MTAVAIAVTLLVPTPGETSPVPSFSESPGCGALDGYRGPLVNQSGVIPMSAPIYGPWGDYFGRTLSLAWAQRSSPLIELPGFPKMAIHQRLLPAVAMVIQNIHDAYAANPAQAYEHTSYSGSWAFLTIPPSRRMSFHAIGAAVDINAAENPYMANNQLITNMPEWYLDAWKDAGWCWGGEWQEIKDAMHFSWMGPLHTPDYPFFPPQPPLVAATDFGATYDLGVGLIQPPPAGTTHHVVDIDRDGAVEVVRVQPWGETGNMALVGAMARNGHGIANIQAFTSGTLLDPSAPRTLADITNDGRPDLVYAIRSASDTLHLQYFALIQGYQFPSALKTTSIPYDGTQTVLYSDHDLDGEMDIYMISAGSEAALTVWIGPDFTEAVGPVGLAAPATGDQYAIGDRNTNGSIDGRQDLFALGTDGRLVIHQGPEYTSTAVIQTPATLGAGDSFHVADLDGDGHDDLFVVKPSGATTMYRGGASSHDPGVWYEWRASDSSSFACPTSFVTGALTNTPQVALVNSASGQWCLRGKYGQLQSFHFGNPGDYPLMGDWNCDGVDTPGMYRQSNGLVYLRNSNSSGNADIQFYFGNPGDIPIAGDFNGDGCDTVSIYRPANQTFYIINTLGQNNGGLGPADFSYVFGNPGDKPFVGDFDGDTIATVGLHRESTGLVYFRNSHSQGNADAQFIFGNPGDRIVAADWNEDGIDSPGLYRPGNRSIYLRHSNSQGNADQVLVWGDTNWLPVAGRFRLP